MLSALLWRGTPYQLFETIRTHDYLRVFNSTVLAEEFAEILIRPISAKRLAPINRTTGEILADCLDVADLATLVATQRVVADDPDDDHVIAAALAVQVDMIVSGDRHLLKLLSHAGIAIVTPADAFARIGGSR